MIGKKEKATMEKAIMETLAKEKMEKNYRTNTFWPKNVLKMYESSLGHFYLYEFWAVQGDFMYSGLGVV